MQHSTTNPSIDANIVLACRNLTRREDQSEMIRKANVDVPKGKITALFGSSGSGKTLLLRALCFLDPIQEGEVYWQGRPLAPSDIPRFRGSCIFRQQKPAFGGGTVKEVLELPFSWAVHRGRQFDNERILAFLHALGRSDSFLNKNTLDLSGGESQIVSLFQALALDPFVMLLDEPTSALDRDSTSRMEKLLRGWLDAKRALVIVSHQVSQIRRLADRVITISGGSVSPAVDTDHWTGELIRHEPAN